MTLLAEEQFSMAEVKKVYLIQDSLIDYYMPQVLEGLKECPGFYEYYTPEWTYEQIKTGHLALWALSDGVIRGIVLSRITVYPKQKVFEILALYGIDMLLFFNEMEDVFMRIAQTFDCETIRATCRPALKRLLKNFHAESEMIVLSRAVKVIGEQ